METKCPLKIEIGEDIKTVRRSCGLTQLQLAEIIDVNRSTLAKWEAGITMAPAYIYKRITMLIPH